MMRSRWTGQTSGDSARGRLECRSPRAGWTSTGFSAICRAGRWAASRRGHSTPGLSPPPAQPAPACDDPDLRTLNVRTLSKLPDPVAFNALVRETTASDPYTRIEAARAVVSAPSATGERGWLRSTSTRSALQSDLTDNLQMFSRRLQTARHVAAADNALDQHRSKRRDSAAEVKRRLSAAAAPAQDHRPE